MTREQAWFEIRVLEDGLLVDSTGRALGVTQCAVLAEAAHHQQKLIHALGQFFDRIAVPRGDNSAGASR